MQVEGGAADAGPADHRRDADLGERPVGALRQQALAQPPLRTRSARVLRTRVLRAHAASSAAPRARAPGRAWATRIRRLAVAAPYTPAMITQTRKKICVASESMTSDQTRPHGEEAVVEALVGGQRRGQAGGVRVEAGQCAARGPLPQEHLQDHEVRVQRGHQAGQGLSDRVHGRLHFSKSLLRVGISWTTVQEIRLSDPAATLAR